MNELSAQITRLFIYFKSMGTSLVEPSGLFQIVLLVALFAAAHVIQLLLEPRMETWVRSLSTSRIGLRQLATVLRSIRGIAFVLFTWLAVVIMRAVTWPSLSYYVGIAANLATAWLIVTLASGFIRNGLLSATFKVIAWSVAALNILGLTTPVLGLLDAAALDLGTGRVSILLILKLATLTAVLLWSASFLSGSIEARLARASDISPSLRVLIGKLSRIGLFALAILIGLQSFGFDLTSLAVFSGAVGVGIGFGLQRVVSNLVSGIILLMDKSIKPGDVISVGETFGWITTLGARYVSVVTRDGREFLIPNEDLITHQVINWTYSHNRVRLEVPFGVSYDSDPHLVRRITSEAAAKPERVVAEPKPVCHLVKFGDSSIDFVLRFWIADPTGGVVNIKGEVLLAVWDALKANGITIPFPQRDLHVKGPITIAGVNAGPREPSHRD